MTRTLAVLADFPGLEVGKITDGKALNQSLVVI
jgi:hypothetical protein